MPALLSVTLSGSPQDGCLNARLSDKGGGRSASALAEV
jgi:hypothetical protein